MDVADAEDQSSIITNQADGTAHSPDAVIPCSLFDYSHAPGERHEGCQHSHTGSVSKTPQACTSTHHHHHCHGDADWSHHCNQLAHHRHADSDGSPSYQAASTSQGDVEAASTLESVSVRVDGMDCSSCAASLERALLASPGVSRVEVNFMRGKAVFQLDTRVQSVKNAIQSAEKHCGLRCTLESTGAHSIDLVMSKAESQILAQKGVLGLQNVLQVNPKVARVSYDPTVVGVRTLIASIGEALDSPSGRAPPVADLIRTSPSDRGRLRAQFLKTAVSASLTIPVVVMAWASIALDWRKRAAVSLALATLVQLIAVPEFYLPALTALIRNGAVELDMLVVISITAAYVYSVVAFAFRMVDRPLEVPELFETSTLLVTFILFGRLVASYARIRATEAVSLRSLQPSKAIVVLDDGGVLEIDSRLLQLGDKFRLMPHARVPTDGLILEGHSEIDESMITGESIPVLKKPGMGVIAGTVNGSGTMLARLTRLPGENTVTDIAGLVEEATRSKPRIQDLSDRVAGYFVPVVSAVAVIALVVWTIVGLRVRSASGARAVADAVSYTVAILAVSCPCALGLAVPMVLVVAGGIAARGGVIIKSGESSIRARKVTDIVFDKTGTITEAGLSVVTHEVFSHDTYDALAVAVALVSDNNHPVSVAVKRFLQTKGVVPVVITETHTIPGDGMIASYQDDIIKAGNPSWTLHEEHPAVARAIGEGLTVLCVTRNDILLACFALRSRLQSDAHSVISQLGRRNITVHLVSGDQRGAVETAASEAGIPLRNVAERRSPAEKRAYVSALMAQGRVVMFCGDGTNDAVAVAQADVGVQMGGALGSSEVTQGASDVVLLAGLGGVLHLLDVTKSAFRRIVFNFVWAGLYNVLAILLAAGAFVRVRIPPAYAGLGELVSILPVILAAATMLLHKPPRPRRP